MNVIIKKINKDKLPIVLAIGVIVSVLGFVSKGLWIYYAATAVMAMLAVASSKKNNAVFAAFFLWLCFCSLVNSVLNWRLLSFLLVLLAATPWFSSPKQYVLRVKVLKYIFLIMPIITVLNLYAHRVGVNYYAMSEEGMGSPQFSGFLTHPLWLGAINGMANVTLLHMYFTNKSKKEYVKYGLLLLLVGAIYISVVAASRAALAASFGGMAVVGYKYAKNGSAFMRYCIGAAVVLFIAKPFLESGSEILMNKMQNLQEGSNTRDVLWSQRINEFLGSPIWGVGFATIHRWGLVISGTIETGSGWLSVLSQTGIVAAGFFWYFLKRTYINAKRIENDALSILFIGQFIYIILHSFFEGYLYTAGYCPCLIFWMLLGVLCEKNKYKNINLSEL